MAAALERLGRQAEALDFFDEITLFTEHDLSAEFTGRMGKYLTPSCPGIRVLVLETLVHPPRPAGHAGRRPPPVPGCRLPYQH